MSKLRLILPGVALVAACAAEPTRPPAVQTAQPPRNVLADIRTEAERYRGAFQVEVIREAAVVEAIEASKRAEMRGNRAAAEAALRDALDDPEARQRYAELLLARGAAARAEQLARESFEAGAKLGEWCARNWLTVAEARVLQDAPNGARQARERASECMPPKVDRH